MAIPLTTFDGRRIINKYDLLALNKTSAAPSHRLAPPKPINSFKGFIFTSNDTGSTMYIETNSGYIAVLYPDASIVIYGSGNDTPIEVGEHRVWACLAADDSTPSGEITYAEGFITATVFDGSNNTALGGTALDANTTGSGNVAIGKDALTENTTRWVISMTRS